MGVQLGLCADVALRLGGRDGGAEHLGCLVELALVGLGPGDDRRGLEQRGAERGGAVGAAVGAALGGALPAQAQASHAVAERIAT